MPTIESNKTQSALPQLVRLADLCEMFSVSPRTIARWLASGDFPKPVRIGLRYKRWNVAEILAFIERLRAETKAEEK